MPEARGPTRQEFIHSGFQDLVRTCVGASLVSSVEVTVDPCWNIDVSHRLECCLDVSGVQAAYVCADAGNRDGQRTAYFAWVVFFFYDSSIECRYLSKPGEVPEPQSAGPFLVSTCFLMSGLELA